MIAFAGSCLTISDGALGVVRCRGGVVQGGRAGSGDVSGDVSLAAIVGSEADGASAAAARLSGGA